MLPEIPKEYFEFMEDSMMVPVNELVRGYDLYREEYEEKAVSVLRSGWYVLGREVEQ